MIYQAPKRFIDKSTPWHRAEGEPIDVREKLTLPKSFLEMSIEEIEEELYGKSKTQEKEISDGIREPQTSEEHQKVDQEI